MPVPVAGLAEKEKLPMLWGQFERCMACWSDFTYGACVGCGHAICDRCLRKKIDDSKWWKESIKCLACGEELKKDACSRVSPKTNSLEVTEWSPSIICWCRYSKTVMSNAWVSDVWVKEARFRGKQCSWRGSVTDYGMHLDKCMVHKELKETSWTNL